MQRVLVAVLGVSLFACGGSHGVAPAARVLVETLPVTRVVLYQNGVGYFERRGPVDGKSFTLQARPSQINDLLKSLTVIDTNDGRAVSVSLPLDKKGGDILAELPQQVRNANGLLQVLSVFRGARVRLEGDAGEAAGRVVGVDEITTKVGDKPTTEMRVTLKTDAETLAIYPVEKIKEIILEDRTLSVGLDQSLDVSLDEGNWKPISLKVHLAGTNDHELIVSYIVEMPRWKPAYRLVFGKEDKALLQGWAVVDNVSGENWNDVSLSLVAGTPMSFIYDLHSPQFTKRVDLTSRYAETAMAPVVERSGYDAAPPSAPAYAPAPAAAYAPSSGAMVGEAKKSAAPLKARASRADFDDRAAANKEEMAGAVEREMERQAPPTATGASVGALFRYDIQDPVTVPDRSSTLVSIVNTRVKGGEVVLFRPEESRGGPVTPYRAAQFVNDAAVTLERGPVAVYAGGTFVGESFVDRMEKGATSFLTYAVDGSMSLVTTQLNSEEGSRLLKITGGMVVGEVLSVSKSTFEITNNHSEPITAYVKTLRRGDYSLRNRPKNTVETPEALFLPLEVGAKQKATLVAEWVRPVVKTIAIDTDLSTTVLKLYLASGKIPPQVAQPLSEVLKIKSRLNDIAEETARQGRTRQTLSDDQERVRDNLNLLRRTTGNKALQEDLVEKLGKIEGQLGKISAKLVQLSEEEASLRQRMASLIADMTLDVSATK